MALSKSKLLNNGFESTYWRIVRLNHVAKDGTDVVLGGFKDKTTSDSLGDQAIIAVENFHFNLGKTDFIDDNPYEKAYGLIKESKIVDGVETNFYVDAEDC